MALTQKQLIVAIEHATRHLASKGDLEQLAETFKNAIKKTENRLRKEIEQTEDRLALTMANSFQDVYSRFDGVDQRFLGIDQRFERMDQRLDGIDQRLDRMDQRFNRLETIIDK